MGLDMYLKVRKHVDSIDYSSTDHPINPACGEIIKLANLGTIIPKGMFGATVEGVAIYWRKVNAIHHWFVTELNDGVDDCEQYHVPRFKLEQLRDLVKEVVDSQDPEVAEELLPTFSGFFFGGTEYDKVYFEDMEQTLTDLNHLLNNSGDDIDVTYQASW